MKLIKIITFCLLLTACVFGTSQTSTFYTLQPQQTTALSNKNLRFIGIDRVQLPKYADRPQMVTQSKDSAEMVVSEYHRWIESPSILTMRVVMEDLSALLPQTQIKMNQFGADRFDKIISIEVVSMNAVLGEKAELRAWYTIKNKMGQISTHQKFASDVQIGKSYDDMAKGYSKLWMELSQDIAKMLIK